MSPGPRTAHGRGFTLIEVVVAMFVVAIGIGALLTTLVSAADNVGYLRDKSFAEWVALNRISEVRLARGTPSTDVVMGEAEFAGQNWRWRQTVTDPGIAGMLRIDVSVARAADTSEAGTDTAAEFAALVTAYGFVGTNAAQPSGFMPDWNQVPPGPGGTPP